MNILFLNPSTGKPTTGKLKASPPLGMGYISAMLKRNGFTNIVGVDLHVDSMSKFESEVVKADVVGVHTVSKAFPQVVELAYRAKQLNPKIKVVIGGGHATLEPEEVISAEPVDFAVVGEGEYTFLELVQALEKGDEFSHIPGIWYKSDSAIKENPPRGWVKNLDELPFPDRELFDIRKYNLQWSIFKSVPIITSRSCPYNCTFCQPALREIIGPYRQRSVENVLSEIRFLMTKYKAQHLSSADNTVTVNRKWVIEFCNELIKQGLKVTWSVSVTISQVDKELLALMKKAGCTAIAPGVESGSQYVLDHILHKKLKIERAREVVREANELKLRIHCYFMIGIPGETREQMLETVELAKTINCESLMFSIVQPQPHIALTRTCEEKGWLLPHSLPEIEKPGLYPFSLYKTDDWLGRSSLFRTDEWGPEFIEEVKSKIVADFDRMGWQRDGFIFENVERAADNIFAIYVGREFLTFSKDFDFIHIKWILKAIKYKIKLLLGLRRRSSL
jgi:radical SAM superfamily enzyme YgiQ (UPF0313 family)